jgi:hypothetical protein
MSRANRSQSNERRRNRYRPFVHDGVHLRQKKAKGHGQVVLLLRLCSGDETPQALRDDTTLHITRFERLDCI